MGFWDRPRGRLIRRALFQVHLWCGRILGLYFVVVCLTGTMVVYKKELERLAIPRLLHVQATRPRGSFAEMVRLVNERYPAARRRAPLVLFVSGAGARNHCAQTPALKVV